MCHKEVRIYNCRIPWMKLDDYFLRGGLIYCNTRFMVNTFLTFLKKKSTHQMYSLWASYLELSNLQDYVLEFSVWRQFLSMFQRCLLAHKVYQVFCFPTVRQSEWLLLTDNQWKLFKENVWHHWKYITNN